MSDGSASPWRSLASLWATDEIECGHRAPLLSWFGLRPRGTGAGGSCDRDPNARRPVSASDTRQSGCGVARAEWERRVGAAALSFMDRDLLAASRRRPYPPSGEGVRADPRP